MTENQPPEDARFAKLRSGTYDVTEGIPPAGHDHVSVRRVEHAGHSLEIHTSYRIFIDGQEFPDPIHVSDDGTVHYHGLPQYSAPSAVDLLKVITDRLVEDEPPPLIGDLQAGPEQGHTPDHGHEPEHGHDEHGGGH